ncbi:hypothetical protein FOS14_13875 [Skermania sp. ID1734]|uniref:hypothetical protein n=1 Tax=Skermania sp. ID1734 TaxID=2597516 RepID=UPI001180CFD8|nr:hypothetical protein [Skermania sp. ID1734]TSD98081.1 hypothetical protein FOS14_13875 [Skermania sp. ID1734]
MKPGPLRAAVFGIAQISAAAGLALGLCVTPASAATTATYQFQDGISSGDPWPFSVETLTATTNGTGVVRLSSGPLCNAIVQTTCAPYSQPIMVSWLNFATGAHGTLQVTSNGVDVATGAGPVALTGGAGNLGIPSLGLIAA